MEDKQNKKATNKLKHSLSNKKIRKIEKELSQNQRRVYENYLAKELEQYKDLPVIID